eukprot:3779298-Pyramimonas_sp.AAC.1
MGVGDVSARSPARLGRFFFAFFWLACFQPRQTFRLAELVGLGSSAGAASDEAAAPGALAAFPRWSAPASPSS